MEENLDPIQEQATQSNASKETEKTVEKIDELDFRIISLLVVGFDNKGISDKLDVPLSTIQRRVRHIVLSKLVLAQYMPNYKLLGIKKGLLHIFVKSGHLKHFAEKASHLKGVLSASVHIGNSDVVAEFIYEDSEDLVEFISLVKQLENVDKVLWSEEVYKISQYKENIMDSFKKYWTTTKRKYDKSILNTE